MSSFQASLLNSGTGLPDLTLDCVNGIINGVDNSNYTTNTDPGHELSDFSLFRKVYISLPTGFTFIYSSLGDGNADITAASSAVQSFAYTLTQGDGIYTFSLLTIPTWNVAVTYSIGDMVYLNGVIYISILNGNNVIVSNTTYWTPQTEAQAKANPKYFDTELVGDNCKMYTCRDNLTVKSFCTIDDCCGTCDLCTNDNLLKSTEMNVLIDTWIIMNQNRDFSRMQSILDKANELCC